MVLPSSTLKAVEKVEGSNEDETIGIEIIKRAVQCPLKSIAGNGGWEGSVIVADVLKKKNTEGFNAATGEYADLIKAGVVDPKKVTRTALQNASSIAGLLLTTECMITDIPEKEEAPLAAIPTTRAWACNQRSVGSHQFAKARQQCLAFFGIPSPTARQPVAGTSTSPLKAKPSNRLPHENLKH